MNIKIICFGRLDKKFFIEAFKDFSDRIKKFANLEVIELKEEFKKENEVNKAINSKTLIEKLSSYNDYEWVCLNVNSENILSEDLAKLIRNNKDVKSGKIVFIVGPSDGYSEEFLNLRTKKISFGNITLPHQLFRVILAEQIYRSFKIINNEKYHK